MKKGKKSPMSLPLQNHSFASPFLVLSAIVGITHSLTKLYIYFLNSMVSS